MRGTCPNCEKEGKFSNPTYRVAKCTTCGHRGDSKAFKQNE